MHRLTRWLAPTTTARPPDDVIRHAGLVIAHAANIASALSIGEFCPFAVVTKGDSRESIEFEAPTQDEAISEGWASLEKYKEHFDLWAFAREGLVRGPDGKEDALVVAAWTRQGPFRWEGTHYQHRVVNPWAVPLQKPYPRVWIPGVLSQETIIWAAKQRYPYIALNTSIEATKKIWEVYDKVALETGYEAGPENRGYLQQVHVSDSEEKAEKNARQFLWMQGEFTGLAHPVWANPSGYFSPQLRRNFVEFAVGRAENPRGRPTFEQQVADGRVFFGTPKTVIPKLRRVLEETRPSIYGIWGNDGKVSNEDARTCIRLLGQEVMPAMREIGKELGLRDPFETNAPVHLKYSTDLKHMPQAAE